jgi:hypothetical protein
MPEDDVIAVTVLLDIVHSWSRRVSRKVSLDLLTQISILVDKYQMMAAVEILSEAWIENLKKDIPEVDYANSREGFR